MSQQLVYTYCVVCGETSSVFTFKHPCSNSSGQTRSRAWVRRRMRILVEYCSASSAVPPMAWAVSGLMSPSRPVVRPDSSSICYSLRRMRRNTIHTTGQPRWPIVTIFVIEYEISSLKSCLRYFARSIHCRIYSLRHCHFSLCVHSTLLDRSQTKQNMDCQLSLHIF